MSNIFGRSSKLKGKSSEENNNSKQHQPYEAFDSATGSPVPTVRAASPKPKTKAAVQSEGEAPPPYEKMSPNPKREPKHQNDQSQESNNMKQKLTFSCQLAQGSPVGIISGFTNVKELYLRIADVYGIQANQILFCTLNTFRVDMKSLLGGQIGLDDFIFAHIKGQTKEVEVTKTQDALGLTITDNGAGYAFIKRIKDDSVISHCQHVKVGDHIEKINGKNLVGCRHFEVAKTLKEIPKGSTFILRLVEPLSSEWVNIGNRKAKGATSSNKSVKNGMQTLRFRANEPARVEDVDPSSVQAQEKINELLENFMGINDADLATQIFDMAEGKSNTMDFAEAIDSSDLEAFGFTDEFIFELWGAITDAKSGRL